MHLKSDREILIGEIQTDIMSGRKGNTNQLTVYYGHNCVAEQVCWTCMWLDVTTFLNVPSQNERPAVVMILYYCLYFPLSEK